MPRKGRVELPGATGVVSCGDRRAEIFRDDVARQEVDEAAWEPLLRGWCLGSAAFRQELFERMEGDWGASPAGERRRESAEVWVEAPKREG